MNFRTEQRLEDFVRNWVSLPGIGEWTAHYIAMRVLNHPDAFPAADLILRREVVTQGPPLSTRALEALAEDWRPWRVAPMAGVLGHVPVAPGRGVGIDTQEPQMTTHPIYYDVIPSPIGPMMLVADDDGLRELRFELDYRPQTPLAGWLHSPEKLAPVRRQLEEYFAGERLVFDLKLNMQGTVFQREVWDALVTIPYGG